MDDLLTYAQTSKAYNIKRGTLYALVAQHRIPHVRLGRRLVRFSRSALDTWLREHSVDPTRGRLAASRPGGLSDRPVSSLKVG